VDNTGGKFKKAPLSVDKESHEYVRDQVSKSFQTAAGFVKTFEVDPKAIRHPTKKNLKLVDARLVIPDLEAYTDAGGYATIKFLTNPVPPSSTYDVRLENSLLRPVQPTEEEQLAREQAQDAHERDPEHNPAPEHDINYEFFLPETAESAIRYKRKLDAYDPEKDDDSLYSNINGNKQGCFRFKRVRAYETALQVGSLADMYDVEVMIAVHDGSDGHRQNAAYYYPICQRSSIRPQRTKNINKNTLRFAGADEDDRTTDFVDMRIEDPDEEVLAPRNVYKIHPHGQPVEEEDGVAERSPSASPTEG
jgi:RNA polymerase II-associated factor 1